MTETYTLADFSHDEWMDRPEYREYHGIAIEHLMTLHEGAELHVCESHIAFVSTDTRQQFELWLYDIITWDSDHAVSTAMPSFRVLGRTWEGVTEVQACPADCPMPAGIVQQMQWVMDYVEQRGWKEDGADG